MKEKKIEMNSKEYKPFLLFKTLSKSKRYPLIALFLIIGFALQIRSTSLLFFIPGTACILCASLLSLVRGITVKARETSASNWEKVTMVELNKVNTKLHQIQKWNSISTASKLATIIIAAIFGGAFIAALLAEQSLVVKIVVIDALILFIPLFVSGSRSMWVPPDMKVKLKALLLLTDFDFIKGNTNLKLQPYLMISKDYKHQNYPEDAKLMIEIAGAPKDFLGIQMQVSINRVKSTAYPYAYAVIVAKKSLNLDMNKLTSPDKKILFESKKQDDVDILVIRQFTTRTSGYHTNDRTIEKIVQTAIDTASSVLKLKIT